MAAVDWRDLRLLRQRAGLRQADIADGLGLSVTYVSKLERGQRNVDLEVARRWCELCGHELAIVGQEHHTLAAQLSGLDQVDAELIRRLAVVLPRLDPAHRVSFLALLEVWERSAFSDHGEDFIDMARTAND